MTPEVVAGEAVVVVVVVVAVAAVVVVAVAVVVVVAVAVAAVVVVVVAVAVVVEHSRLPIDDLWCPVQFLTSRFLHRRHLSSFYATSLVHTQCFLSAAFQPIVV